MENQKREKEITISQLWDVLKKSAVLMIIAAILGGALAVVYSVFLDKPEYEATASFWVNTASASYDYASQSQTAAAISLATSCVELANKDLPVRTAVQKHELVTKLGYKSEDACVKAVRSMIKAYKSNETTVIFHITVKADTPKIAYETISALQDVMPGVLDELCSLKQNESNAPLVNVIGPVTNIQSVVKVKSSPIVMGLIGAVAAAMVVYVVFFILSMFDTLVYTESTIKNIFDYPIIGRIPSIGSSEDTSSKKKFKVLRKGQPAVLRNYGSKLISESSPFFATEAFNTLRTNLVYAAVATKNPIFAVTSDIAGVGKTVVASNLAISFANLEKKVLLVECDMRCPVFSKLFSLKVENGLSELLAGIYDKTDDVVQNVGIENLDVVFSGKIPPNPSELLSGYRMDELVEEWKSKYDYIIFDMPPIGEVFDAGVVASVVNGYVLTVRCNHSDINGVRDSVSRVESVNGHILGIVLNDINPKSNKRYKYYYSSYAKSSD